MRRLSLFESYKKCIFQEIEQMKGSNQKSVLKIHKAFVYKSKLLLEN